jgi:AcrR family transcriptional regulator
MSRSQRKAQRADGSSPRLSRELILKTALRLVDEQGLDALSMRQIAAQLKVTPMALYGYVETRDEILDAMTEYALDVDDVEIDSSAPWAEQLTRVLRATGEALEQHPGVVDVLVAQAGPAPAMDQVRERLLAALASAGLDDAQQIEWLSALSSYTLGHTVIERTRRRLTAAGELERLRTLPASQFPNVTQTARQFVQTPAERTFEFGLAVLIAGLRAAAKDGASRHDTSDVAESQNDNPPACPVHLTNLELTLDATGWGEVSDLFERVDLELASIAAQARHRTQRGTPSARGTVAAVTLPK